MADVVEALERIEEKPLEDVQDSLLARLSVRTEPVRVSGCGRCDRFEVEIGILNIIITPDGGFEDTLRLAPCAVSEHDALPSAIGTPGDSEVSGELYLSNTFYSCVEVLEGTASTDVREEVRRFDGVASSARASEIVRSRHWW